MIPPARGEPLIIKVPERTVERTIIEKPVERQTEPLPVTPSIHIEVPAQPAAAPHIVNVPERSKDENNQSVPGETTPVERAPYPETERAPDAKVDVSPVVEKPVKQVEPEQKTLAPEPAKTEPKSFTPDNKKFNEPIKFSQPETPPQASSRPKMKHVARTRGRQRKYHETIALLEDYRDGETDQLSRLDPQMQRYYRREYPDYFGRDSKAKASKRLSNRTKATRTKRESERRRIAEISRSIQGIPDNRPEDVDAEHTA